MALAHDLLFRLVTSNKAFSWQLPTPRRHTLAVVAVVQIDGDPPDRIDQWRVEQSVREHVAALVGGGDEDRVGVGLAVSSFELGDAPEWVIEAAASAALASLTASDRASEND